MATPKVQVKRAYDEPASSDGTRVLVDRIWPRGVARDSAHLEEWMKEVAPSTALRKWYGHDRDRFSEFRRRYLGELKDADHAEALARLRRLARRRRVTLVTATRDVDISAAAVLASLL
jgi:uncharacterized protein YeaO (DUF488 family)